MAGALFVGGVRSGKSAQAEAWTERQSPRRIYLATGVAADEEMRRRIELHRARRGPGWQTLEAPRDPLSAVEALAARESGPASVMLDCLSMWLATQLELGLNDNAIFMAGSRLVRGLLALPWPCAIVSAECGLGLAPIDSLARRFVDLLGALNQLAAQACAEVYLASCGLLLPLKKGAI